MGQAPGVMTRFRGYARGEGGAPLHRTYLPTWYCRSIPAHGPNPRPTGLQACARLRASSPKPYEGLGASDAPARMMIVAEHITEIAYNEAVRGLDEQAAALREVRSRSGTLLAAASLVTAFLGADPLTEPLGGAAWVAVAFFVLVATCSVLILLSGDWKFSASPRMIFQEVESAGTGSVEAAYEELAHQLEAAHDENEERLDRTHWLIRGASVFLAIEVGTWIWSLA
jgi:hypothetical protein